MKKLAIASIISLTACYSPKASFTYYDNAKNLSPYSGDVKILSQIPKDKIIHFIGETSTRGFLINSDNEMIKALQRRAGNVGANAIVLKENKTEILNSFVSNLKSQPKSLSPNPIAASLSGAADAYKNKDGYITNAPKYISAVALKIE